MYVSYDTAMLLIGHRALPEPGPNLDFVCEAARAMQHATGVVRELGLDRWNPGLF